MRSNTPPHLYIRLFGGLRAQPEGNTPLHFTAQQTGALLAYLALYRHRAHSREELLELIWPDTDPEEARHNLRQSLYSLRRQLDPAKHGILLTTRTTVQLNPDLVATDVDRYEMALEEAATASDPEIRIQLLSKAVELYDGELLPGFYQDAFIVERNRLNDTYQHALVAQAQTYGEAGDFPAAMECARHAIVLDPLREEAHRTLMQLYAMSGQSAVAIRQYKELERILQELHTEPSEESRRLLARLRQMDSPTPETSLPASVPTSPTPLLLPAQLSEESPECALPTISQTDFAPQSLTTDAARTSPAPIQNPTIRPSLRRRVAILLTAAVLASLMFWVILAQRRAVPHKSPSAPPIPNEENAPMGTILWQTPFPLEPLDKKDSGAEPTAITFDTQSNIYVTGYVDTSDHDVDFLILKISPAGKLIWQARYNSKNNEMDRARYIAVDEAGCVYVVGESDNGRGTTARGHKGWDIAIVKYDPDGKFSNTWPDIGFGVGVRRYNGPEDDEDQPTGLALAPSGNVYVAGSCLKHDGDSGRSGRTMVLLKCTTNGTLTPLLHYDGGHGDDIPCGVVCDREENVYIAGAARTEPSSGPEYDYLTFKFNKEGKKEWTKSWGDRNGADDKPHNIGIDAGGNIYLVGMGRNLKNPLDANRLGCIVVKYAPNGDTIWVHGTDKEIDRLTEIRSAYISSGGEVAVAGLAKNEQGVVTCRTLYRDENGMLVWPADYEGIQGDDGPNEIAIGTASNVYVCGGFRQNRGDVDFFTLNYNVQGYMAWKHAEDLEHACGHDRATAITIMPDHNPVVAIVSAPTHSITVIRYHH